MDWNNGEEERSRRTCPRCRSSMIVDADAAGDGDVPVWKCLGCGTVYLGAGRQADDERLRRRIIQHACEQSWKEPW